MSTPLHALIIEDVPDDAMLLLYEFKKGGYDVTYEHVETAEAMQAALRRESWDIIFCDYKLPEFNASQTLLTIINDILDFSKIEADKLQLEIIDFNLRRMIEDIVVLHSERAHSKGLELLSFVETTVPAMLRGDPFRIGQVLNNLLGNAIKLTERGKVVARVTPVSFDEGKANLRFKVIDTGIGMSAGQIERLFQSFTQADASPTRKYGGTGLGLAISKHLVQMMGGEINVESVKGKSSHFWFNLPLQISSEEAMALSLMPIRKPDRFLTI